ncbi:uncharacterized protein LOC143292511 isoform X2 [Babylonia areolata]|uniref:uncharacterized protein LOC143292511 isoform X2 n=1 Tax=Babylonia areolata TaxID=304850 RepID=UPI003FD26CC9
MAALGDLKPRTVRSFRAKPTEARPKHSLFGTALENINKSELEGIDASDANRIGVKNQPERYPIPEHLQGHVSARTMVDKARQDISSQNQVLTNAQKQLKEKEQKALMFRPDSERKERGKSREHAWLTKQDLDHSEDINNVGLSKSGNFNHDKYGNKPPTHNYSLIGDVLSKGNEFGHCQKYDPDQSLAALNVSDNNNLGAIRLGWNPRVDPDTEMPLKPKSAVKLPPNIRHQFGSRVCDSLLADKKKVSETMEKQKKEERASKSTSEIDIKEYEAKASSSYFDVGHVTRFNVFPGYSMLDMNSTMRATHNDVVYLRRVPMTDEYRIIKDGYATWAEQNLVREKLKKQWDAPKT